MLFICQLINCSLSNFFELILSFICNTLTYTKSIFFFIFLVFEIIMEFVFFGEFMFLMSFLFYITLFSGYIYDYFLQFTAKHTS